MKEVKIGRIFKVVHRQTVQRGVFVLNPVQLRVNTVRH